MNLIELSDEELMKKIKDRNQMAFTVLVKRHAKRFYSLTYRTIFKKNEAEDIVQEAFIKLWCKPNMWNEKKNIKFTTWFYRVIVNACYDFNKKNAKTKFEENTKITETYIDDIDNDEVKKKILKRAINRLPIRQRAAINLCFYECLSNEEAAQIMGIKLKALQSLLMRGKTTLKTTVNSEYLEDI